MKNTLKRIFSLLMVLAMLGSMLPAVYADDTAAPSSEPVVLTDEDYAPIDDLFAQIDEMEASPAKKSATETQLADAATELVMASDNYVEGSLERNGNFFTWWTDEGIRCVYSPRMREIESNMVAPENPLADGAYNEPVATKGGWPSGNQVYLIGPYYGSDSSFTDQYKNEAKAIASAIGDTDGYTLYSGTAATVDKVATAVSNGAVVIFDSHGSTDYESGNDYVTGANNSYLCLETSTGMTNADYNDGAMYGSGYAYINGATIENHMTKDSPAGIVWMAICLGMATDTLCEPLRNNGVEVVYGYSQSVTFAGDYLFEETFWDNMCAGKDVATSIAAMKSKWGNWDWSTTIATYYDYTDGYSTISEARADYAAFPVVVSDEDAHPGQRSGSSNYGACSLQTVKSTYTLFSQYNVTALSNNTAWGTVSVSGSTITATPATGYFAESATVTSGTATVSQNGNTFSVVAESDCTVQINFAAKTAVTVSFSDANVAVQTGYAGDAMSLPTAEAPEGYKFLGWTTVPLSEDTTEKPNYYTDSFTPTANTTLYALYSYVKASTDGGSGDYVKVTETPADWSGEYLIVYENGTNAYIFNSVDDSDGYVSATITDNTIESNTTTDAEAVTIEAMTGGYAIKTKNGYIYGTSGSNKLNFDTSSQQLNTLSLSADGTVLVTSNTSVLRFNDTSGQYRFRYYKSSSYSNQKAIALYVKDGSAGTTYYTSTLCEHTNTTEVAALAATCTEIGYTAGVQCTDCGNYVSGHEVISALGHSYGAGEITTAPTCTVAGVKTYTCSACGDSYTGVVAATGHSMGEGTVTNAATCTADGVMTYTCVTCGTTETEAIPATGHSYSQWTQTSAPTCTEAGEQTSSCDVCGEAIIQSIDATGHTYVDGACSVCGEAEPEVSDARFYIAAVRSSGNYFYMTSNLGTSSTKRYQAVDSGLTVLPESITEPQDGYVFLLVDNGDGTYSLQVEGVDEYGYLGHVSGNSGALVDADSALKLTIDVSDNGIYNIHYTASDAERYLSLNATVNYNYFAWYKSGQIADLALIPVEGTSLPDIDEPVVTEPEATEPEATEPEATEPEASEPAGSTTTLQYVFSDYAAGTQYAQGESHTLDDVVTLTINGAHLNTQVRLYAGSNAVFTSAKEIDSIIVKAGYKAGTLNVYASADGSTWELVSAQATTTTYTNYSFDMPEGTMYVKLEGVGAQIRVSEMSIDVLEGGTTEPTPSEPEVTEPEVTEPEVTEPEVTEPDVSEPVVGSSATIDFSTTDQRVSQDANSQVWTNAGATLTNNKGSSTSVVADYSNPARFYKNSDIIVAFPGMTKIEFTCNTAEYATTLANSISNATVTTNGQLVTVEFAEPADEFSFTLTSGQVRMNELTVYGSSPACEHSYEAETTPASCTEAGKTVYTCTLCGDTYEEEIPAAGHSYVLSGTTYTCSVCGDSYEIFYVSFSVPEGVTAVEKIEYANGGIALPTAEAPEGYTFVGWTEATVDNTTEKPEIFTAGAAYEATEAITLQAVYTYVVANADGDKYVKVTEAPADWSGEYLIVYELDEKTGYIFDGTLAKLDAAKNYQQVTITDSTITAEAGDPYKFTISAVDGGYSILSVSGLYIGRESNGTGNGLTTSATKAYVNTLSLDSYGAVITSQAGTYLKFNANTNDMRFRYYGSGQKTIQLYAKNSGTTYYTTEIVDASVENWNITLGDNIGVNFYMNVANASFTVAENTVQMQGAIQEDGTYMFTVELAAAQMTDEIKIAVNGKALEKTYSVREYADVILTDANNEYSVETKALVNAMLVYGGASQTVFGYNTTSLASNGITDAPANALEAAEEIALSDSIDALDFYGASLSYRNKIAVRFYFTADSVEGITFKIGETEYTPVAANGMYYIEVAGILPQNIGKQITVTVTETEENAISVSYGPMNYIERMSEKGNAEVQALVNALYNYYKAAAAYIAE